MRKLLLLLITAIIAVSCTSNKATIKAKIEGLNNGQLVLKVLRLNAQSVVDTIKTDSEGSFIYRTKKLTELPEFYYLYHKERKVASLILTRGDKIYLTSDTLGLEILIEGSSESTLLNELEKELLAKNTEFEKMLQKRSVALENKNGKLADSLNFVLGSMFVKNKQEAIKHLYLNPNSLTNVYLMYHKMPGDLPLFGDMRDILLYKRVFDSLSVVYPGSPYLNPILDEISLRERSEAFSSKLLDASEVGFPDIKLPDTKSQIRSLSELSGKPFILVFWSVNDVNQKLFNRDLLELYDRYSPLGLEIYQVSVDTDKTAWARAVAEQSLPWINVCDGLGSASQALATYNIKEVPSLFVIDKSGSIVARDVFDSKLSRAIAKIF
jgi:peroxiredoxin